MGTLEGCPAFFRIMDSKVFYVIDHFVRGNVSAGVKLRV
jgi:hypothetical protein